MKKINLSVKINAPVKKVWDTLIGEKTYREWASTFSPGCYFKGDWSKGSKMLFLGPDPQTGKEGGMVSEIADNIPYKFISIQHNGYINDGVEDTTSAQIKAWAPSYENYTFTEIGDSTEFTLDMDTTDEYHEMFLELWPKALAKLKEICERSV